jgi:hypothetical protein
VTLVHLHDTQRNADCRLGVGLKARFLGPKQRSGHIGTQHLQGVTALTVAPSYDTFVT